MYCNQLGLLVSKSPVVASNFAICLRTAPPEGAKQAQNLPGLATKRPKPRTGRILGYVAETPILRAHSRPENSHFLWFPRLKITQLDA